MSVIQVFKTHKFSRLVIAGLAGTLAFYIAAFIDMGITGIPLDITVVLGQLVAGEHQSAQMLGHVFHIANSIGLSLFFGFVFLPISNRIIQGKIWIHGIIFGILVTVTTVWFGLFPSLDAGIAGLNIAPEVPAMTMFRHIVFGAVIGIIFKPALETKK